MISLRGIAPQKNIEKPMLWSRYYGIGFLLWALACLAHRSFSQSKNGEVLNNKPAAMRVRVDCYTTKITFPL